ncbi:Cys-Gln thioester bond-forming surface protein [Blastococcus sp. Marseille-P5729]|uniref:Cys-Gln thioester bond-forming surface protein n=1 Tax=Blastococcus sp. Marseille-P5729 TaxID=2086582 RepID=UPI00131C6461|nr:Cys-Gln thioester bond-forming surface protein [Blastococcus sp. Marseille-P5729]
MKSRLTAALAAAAVLLITPSPGIAEEPASHAGDHADSGVPIRVAGHGQLGTYTYDIVTPGQPVTTAYCIDLTTKYRKGAPLRESSWSQAPAIAPFAPKVSWVLHHSYPYLPLDQIAPGISFDQGLSTREAVAATQAAIWHYSNGISLKATDVVGSAGEKQDVVALYSHLTGPDNVGTSEVPDAKVELAGVPDDAVAGQRIGPIMITTATPTTLSVEGPQGVRILDAAGKPVDSIDTATEVFLDVPVDLPPGTATITAVAEGTIPTGRIFTPARTDAESVTQTLVLATVQPTAVTAEKVISWRAAPRLHTVAVDSADGDKLVLPGGTVTDTVAYEGFTTGETYTVTGELIDVATGARVGEPVEVAFMAEQTDGTFEGPLVLPSGIPPGTTLVVFERAFDANGDLVAEHADVTSAPQTVTVQQPPAPPATSTPPAPSTTSPRQRAPRRRPAPSPPTSAVPALRARRTAAGTPAPSPAPTSMPAPTSAAAPSPVASEQLADTGADSTRWALIGGSLLLLGVGTTLLGRRAR